MFKQTDRFNQKDNNVFIIKIKSRSILFVFIYLFIYLLRHDNVFLSNK